MDKSTVPAATRAASAWDMAAKGGEKTSLSYSPLKFYCAAHDNRGHGQKVSFNLPPHVYAMVMNLVQSGDYPIYENPTDFMRDAIVHHLNARMEGASEPAMRESMMQLTMRLEFEEHVETMVDDLQRWQKLCDGNGEALSKLAQAGAWRQVGIYIHKGRDLLEGVAEPYRTMALKTLDEWDARIPEQWR